jgi:hypothetical protein
MQNRKGEKFGWIGGWMGGFIWLFLLAIFWILPCFIPFVTAGSRSWTNNN